MIKKALLFSIVLIYTGVSLAEITLLSKARVFHAHEGEDAKTYCVEGYVVAVINSTSFQLLGNGGEPLTCRGKIHDSIQQ